MFILYYKIRNISIFEVLINKFSLFNSNIGTGE